MGIDHEKKIKRMKQVCPFCFRALPSLTNHKCITMPDNFEFPPEISGAKFFYGVYQVSEGITDQGKLDIHKLHPLKYKSQFQNQYNQFLEEGKFDSSQFLKILQFNPTKSDDNHSVPAPEIRSSGEKLKLVQKRIKQICPFCLDEFESLVPHQCSELITSRPDFHFAQELLTDSFFLYLYRKLEAWTKNGLVKTRRLNRVKYHDLFFKIYNRMEQMENPSLDFACDERNYLDIENQNEIKQSLKEFIEEEKSSLMLGRIGQVCPYCYHIFSNLADHRCENMPPTFQFPADFSEKVQDTWFMELYRQTNSLTEIDKYNPKVDLHKMNRATYSELFLESYSTFTLPETESNASSNQRSSNSEKISMESLESEFAYLDEDEPENQNNPKDNAFDFNDLTVSDYSNSKSNSISNSKVLPSGDKNQSRDSNLDESIPLCFSCQKMMNCPRGFNSEQMENVFSCSFFADMTQQKEKKIKSSNEDEVSSSSPRPSLCDSCDHYGACPLKKTVEEQKSVYECPEYTSKQKDLKINRIFCSKCNMEMRLIETMKNDFYRCQNYPECQVTADPFYVKQAISKRVVSHIEHGDLLYLYRYEEEESIIWISQIFSEGKLFL